MLRRSSLLSMLILLLAGGAATTAQAQFNPAKPETVSIVLLPFEPERESDASVALLLEDYVTTKLPRKVKQPLIFGSESRPSFKGAASSCVKDAACLKKVGAAFQSSLIAHVSAGRAGPDMKVTVSWYSTGNGVRLGRDEKTVAAGDEGELVTAMQGWIGTYFPASLKINAGSLAGEGGLIGDDDQAEREAEYKSARQKRVSSRREDFGSAGDSAPGDEDEDLRAVSERERGGAHKETRTKPMREAEPEPRSEDRRAEADDTQRGEEGREDGRGGADASTRETQAERRKPERETDAERRKPERETVAEPRPEDEDVEEETLDDEADLDALEEERTVLRRPSDGEARARAADIAIAEDAERAGFGPREKERFARTGESLDAYLVRRWAYGKRLHIRLFGTYGAGFLTRRYATIVFIRAGNVQTDEYYYESLGSSFVNPGGGVGISFAPVDPLEIGLDFSVLYARQGLRREYVGHDFGTSVCGTENCPPEAQPKYQATAHAVIDVGARFFLPPTSRVKFVPGVLFTAIVMQGYQIQSEPPIAYSDRPTAGVIGLSPTVGLRASLSPFVSLFLDVPVTILLSHGAAKAQEHRLEGGVSEGYLEAQYMEEPPSSGNLMVRANLGVMLHF